MEEKLSDFEYYYPITTGDFTGPRIDGIPDPDKFHGTLRADGTVITASLPPSAYEPDAMDVESEALATLS